MKEPEPRGGTRNRQLEEAVEAQSVQAECTTTFMGLCIDI